MTLQLRDTATAFTPIAYEDPTSHDLPSDQSVVTTGRGLCRMAMVAAEVAARFKREGMDVDPVAWMLAPRRLFGGASALTACLEERNFLRASLLHGLSIGLDAEPADIDGLLSGGSDDDGHDVHDFADEDIDYAEEREEAVGTDLRPGDLRLYTATIAHVGDGVIVHAFHASLACTAREIDGRLRRRFGAALAAEATIVSGFRSGGGPVAALVSPLLAEMLRDVAADPSSPIAAGLDLNLEQRFDM
ncbi:MAG: hypothetical protein ACRYG4_19410 [Janthinobacterium lividum]